MIKLDSTQNSVIILCTECEWWHSFRFTKLEGWASGAAHQSTFHPEDQQAAKALDKARKTAAKEIAKEAAKARKPLGIFGRR